MKMIRQGVCPNVGHTFLEATRSALSTPAEFVLMARDLKRALGALLRMSRVRFHVPCSMRN